MRAIVTLWDLNKGIRRDLFYAASCYHALNIAACLNGINSAAAKAVGGKIKAIYSYRVIAK